MMVKLLEILTEYISIIFCLHKVSEKKIIIDKYVLMLFIVELISVLVAEQYRSEHSWMMMGVYCIFFLYTKKRLCEKWSQAIKAFCTTIIIIPSMQLVIYFSTKFIFDSVNNNMTGALVNVVNSLLIYFWKKEYFYRIAKRLVKSSSFIIVLLFLTFSAYLLNIYKKSDFINEPLMLRSLAGIAIAGIIAILLMNAENEKKNKAKELQLYRLYNKTFEEAIIAIRMRQHEFDNHINAIKCLQLTIEDSDTVIKVQNEYCDKVLSDNSFNKLLTIQLEPILIGFLYSKFVGAKEQGIKVIHEIHAIKVDERIEISELIEVIGILFDNAVEALSIEQKSKRKMIVKILQEDKKQFSIEIANISRKYLNSEIEKFCLYGYSTKGKNRGIGLSRVKVIVKKYRIDFLIANVQYNEENYLSFKLILKMK